MKWLRRGVASRNSFNNFILLIFFHEPMMNVLKTILAREFKYCAQPGAPVRARTGLHLL